MNVERNTVLAARAARHAALADIGRLQVLDALALSDRSPSELQAITGLPSNLMAHHLKVLEAAGVVARRRSEGDRRRTYITLSDETALDDVGPSLSAERVLFVCSANSARSQLAAALWAQLSDVPVGSAGTHPAETISAGAREVAARKDLDLVSESPRLFAASRTSDDLVVAVCDNAYEELGNVVDVHWSVPDPVRVGGQGAFDDAFDEIRRRVVTLAPRLLAS
ncbi:ArsR family transcriptional regulator [Aeromicrobium sp. Root495]|uniref:arsenate reductase/protein-tyrosine-phosphatase family protein n=1 Tax=Aeromicrobium sp. Root495 TaxID=1736550 RepID=UPI0006FC39E2|nr:MarR family transcriptional regulator [Aeromicrobium sp. Root495]KQY55317.1 ArsR family transcriptional regulator [Aeromicrobium sp. Root495]